MRVVPLGVGGEVVDEEGGEHEEQCAEEDWREDELVAHGLDGGSTDDGGQGGAPAWRMHGSGPLHEGDGDSDRGCGGELGVATDPALGGHADQGAYQVTADEVAGLGEVVLREAEDQDSRGSEGGHEPAQRGLGQWCEPVQRPDEEDPDEAAHGRPEDPGQGFPGWAFAFGAQSGERGCGGGRFSGRASRRR